MNRCEERRVLRGAIGTLVCSREVGHPGIHRDNSEGLWWMAGAPPLADRDPYPGVAALFDGDLHTIDPAYAPREDWIVKGPRRIEHVPIPNPD